ncbi:MAG: ribonuclease P protein component [Prevotella sp.]|nr:ribonuclease P protein component [Prevotella sp.]MCM1075066.1 ribonuclease P protein component [Ruminococcus sp.]
MWLILYLCTLMSDETVNILQPDTPARRLTFRKGERLRHHALVEQLFDSGESVYAYPLRMFYRFQDEAQMLQMFHGCLPHSLDRLQMMITVPKKKFRHAVDRVWLRRRIREAYRLNRNNLKDKLSADTKGRYLQIAFLYVGGEKRDYAAIEKKMIKLLEKAETVLAPEAENADEEK